MMIHEITQEVGRNRARKRVGRGEGTGHGKTSGRGHKGAASRSGWRRRAGYEGGQMPLFRRVPKRGFSNVQFARPVQLVNLKTLEARLDDGAEVTPALLARLGIIRDGTRPVKILGEGTLSKKLTVSASRFSKSARAKIEEAGGSVHEITTTKWTRAEAKPSRAKPSAAGG